MNQFFKSVKFKIIVCIAAFFLGIALYSVTKDGQTSEGSQLVGTVLNPVKKFSNMISDKVSLVIDLFVNSEDYVEENQKLKEQIADLNSQLIDYEDMKSEVEDLRKFIGIKEENKDFVLSPPCTIISRMANDPYGTFVIDKGSNDGISLYDPVVTSEGLVGVITEVAKSYSTVRTLLSPELSVGGLCVESRDTGIIEGSLSLAADGKCKMIYLDKNHKIKEGDLIITSGNSGQFPQGYVIGNVTETGIEESGLTAYAVIEPAVNPNKINNVMVITDFDRNEQENQIPTGNIGEETTENTTESSDDKKNNDDNSETAEDPTEETTESGEE
ncbi:rod shape-determining protein MreC [Porcipelethomonas sp.]|uniref:rod shape-determining protein MreC n=1 Tax=Porcipelethomonas sp. TaxID=2981675 RepID=UPI003EF89E34